MKKLITNKLEGPLSLPESKTHIHRILFIMLLSQKEGYLKLNNSSFLSDDIKTTIDVLKKLNCIIRYNEVDELLYINSKNLIYDNSIIDCNESGTTLRISIVIVLHLFGKAKFTGSKKLLERPLDFYEKLFKENDINFQIQNNILEVRGSISNIFKKDYIDIKNCKSSQFITALMLIAPSYKSKLSFIFIDNMESVSYLKVTATILKQFNIDYTFIYNADKLTSIKLNKEVKSSIVKSSIDENNKDIYVYQNPNKILEAEIDYSSLAFWLVANKLGANIIFNNKLYKKEEKFIHPDQEIISILEEEKQNINLKDCPDLLPILLVWTSLRENIKTIFINFQRNRFKESNRVEGMVNQLVKLGANIKVYDDKIEVVGVSILNSGEIDTLNDHRIAMSFAIASLKVAGELKINNPLVVQKSYYKFWEDFNRLS